MTDDIETRRRRAYYRASHRGTKEMDWLLGRYAEAVLPRLDGAELELFETLLALPDPDLNRMIIDQAAAARSDLAPHIRAIRALHGL